MKNSRNAGRKSKLDTVTFNTIKSRIANGESVAKLAIEYNISRQALYKKLKQNSQTISFDYFFNDKCATRVEIDYKKETVHIINYASKISERAFGVNNNPSWNDLLHFLEDNILKNNITSHFICHDKYKDTYSLKDIVEQNSHIKLLDDVPSMPDFKFTRKDFLTTRTDTDGFQAKALSKDRRFFIKSQAIISGTPMNDWAVELIASDLCRQLDIPCVIQNECTFSYDNHYLKGVYSENFELDGYTFISFERLLERIGLSSRDEEFIKLNSIQKLKWCAEKLSIAGNLDFEFTLKYMLDLALIDCLVGNVDRHTRNFGLFFNTNTGLYEIPLIFDNGMGLFEHDRYKDEYENFEAAMRSVYISPYGEDPFDMIEMLDNEFDLLKTYPDLSKLTYHTKWITAFAKEYIERILRLWQK